MLRQGLRQPLIKRGMFHIDDHTADAFQRNLFGKLVCFFLRGQSPGHRNIACPIGEQNDQRLHIRMGETFLAHHLIGKKQTRRKRSLASHRDVCQGTLGQLHRIRRRENEPGAVLLKHDQPNPIPALVRIGQQ